MFIKKRIHLISILMIIIAIVLLWEVAIANSISAQNFGNALGQRLIPLLLISLIFRRYPKVFLCSSILFLSLSIYTFYLSYNQRVKDAQMAKSMNEMNQIFQLALNEDAKSISSKNYLSGEYGEAGPLLKIVSDGAEFSNRQSTRLVEALEKVDFENILSPEKLCNQEEIISSIEKLNAFSNVLDECANEQKQYIEEIEAKAHSQIAEGVMKESFLEGFKNSINSNSFLASEFYRIQKERIRVCKCLLKFMKFIRGSYTYVNQTLVFDNDIDLKMYQDYLYQLNNIGKQNEEVLHQMESQKNSMIQKFEKFPKVQ